MSIRSEGRRRNWHWQEPKSKGPETLENWFWSRWLLGPQYAVEVDAPWGRTEALVEAERADVADLIAQLKRRLHDATVLLQRIEEAM